MGKNRTVCYVNDSNSTEEGWMLVARKERSEEAAKASAERAETRARMEEDLMKDPTLWFLYQQDADILHTARRLKREPEYRKMSDEQLLNYVKRNCSNAGLPVVVRKTSSDVSPHKTFNAIKATHVGDARDRRVERNADEGRLEFRMFDKQFIRDVTARRNELKLTQAELAALAEVTEGDIKRFEKGEMQYSGGLRARLIWKLEL